MKSVHTYLDGIFIWKHGSHSTVDCVDLRFYIWLVIPTVKCQREMQALLLDICKTLSVESCHIMQYILMV
jgi:hypothetical protein